jgi:hypothetical protein
MKDPWDDILDISKSLKRKQYINEYDVRQFSPHSEIVYEPFFGMQSYEIKHDSIKDFLRQNNVKKVYIDQENNKRYGALSFFDQTTVVIRCEIG